MEFYRRSSCGSALAAGTLRGLNPMPGWFRGGLSTLIKSYSRKRGNRLLAKTGAGLSFSIHAIFTTRAFAHNGYVAINFFTRSFIVLNDFP